MKRRPRKPARKREGAERVEMRSACGVGFGFGSHWGKWVKMLGKGHLKTDTQEEAKEIEEDVREIRPKKRDI